MNVVGKVGSLISQGVYSVATPFHPFGGAVDIIAVKQQDGTFRSAPWYVRFGKFQGVLKGAEKMVRITVNGIEADFHMYLDNSGEAYFVREVGSGESGDAKRVSNDSGNLNIAQENNSVNGTNSVTSGTNNSNVGTANEQLERTESDSGRRFYEFEDEQSSLVDSVELSEYGSSQFESLDTVEHFVESQGLSSEVVLVSVDGHILTAPFSSSETSADNLHISTPQFRLGPGQETDFVEGTGEFSAGEEVWGADILSDLGTSAPEVSCSNTSNASRHQMEVCEGDREHLCHFQENENITNVELELCVDSNPKTASAGIRREDVFKSCLELPALALHHGNSNQQVVDPILEICETADDLESPHSCQLANGTGDGDGDVGESRNGDGLTHSNSDPQVEVELIEERTSSSYMGVHNVTIDSVSADNKLKEPVDKALEVEGVQCSPQGSAPEGIELSLCGNLLHAGMGLNAAAEVFNSHRISEGAFKTSAASIAKNENLVVRFQDRYLSWDKAAPIVLGVAAYGLDLPVDPKDAIPVEQDGSSVTSTPSGRRWRLWPSPFRRVKTVEHTTSNASSEEVFVDSESGSQNQPFEQAPTTPTGGSESPHKQLVRTNVPTTEQIASLNLQEGQNMVTFSFSTRVLGTQQVDAHIYLWKWNARIVISDVDGTITKSDVLGQFMPLVGKDWTQSGVARLFSAIKENGYQLLFLSARAIVQAYLTRSFLLNLKQDGKALPSGPVVISPDGLFPSLFREAISSTFSAENRCLTQDIKALFPPEYNPFYAGFGNRDTDELSYRKIGIPKGKIFIINPKGEVAISHRIDVKSYTSLHTLVNDMFPPTSMVEQEDFNSWNYWRMPLPDVE
ncbi:hypothetical protein RHGRI_015145 [Rhododendron griersonianum]|uniref:phosphatidate phosphatase n=1 Tax=Rhododendron griersonianum TaxID=479676 RepID=A0AAV6KCA5_9ERIC|nr:hypothetical protein RHGRI_015145 [Rhododendron griersonianum]